MKNIITIYELMGLIKDDKAPKNIKHDDVTLKEDIKIILTLKEYHYFQKIM